jgi:hypothetical protein
MFRRVLGHVRRQPVAFVALFFALGLLVAPSTRADLGQHDAITITSNADFTAVGSLTGCACVSAGDGTAGNPFVIGPWTIRAPSGGTSGWAIEVDNSAHHVTDSFTISGIAAAYSGVPRTDPVIQLVYVNNPAGTTISNVSANEDGLGVELDHSSHVTLDQLNFNKMTGNSLFINGSSYVDLSNSKLKSTADGQQPHNADGLYALDSSYLRIGGLPACPSSQICNTFDYDTGFGVYLQNTNYVSIEHASANADDTGGYILDNSSNVDLGNSTSQAGGPICITLNGQKTPTGYVPTDLQGGLLLINGSSNDTIHDDQFAQRTMSLGSGGNGFYANPCLKMIVPFSPSPPETPMGPNNSFTNDCYFNTDIPALPPNRCN